MGTPITGTYGSVRTSDGAEVAEITGWSAVRNAATKSYQSSSSAGYRKRATGGKDLTGEFTFLYNCASAASRSRFEEGDSFTVVLAVDSAKAHTIVAPIVIESVSANADVDGDALVGGTARFGGNGAYSLTGALAVDMSITSSS